jgi:hypothetical protein
MDPSGSDRPLVPRDAADRMPIGRASDAHEFARSPSGSGPWPSPDPRDGDGTEAHIV